MRTTKPAIRLASLLLASAASLALAQTAHAQSRWDGSDSTDYNDPDNWSTGVVPTSATVVVIDTVTNAPVVSNDAIARARNLSVGEAGTGILTITSGADLVLGDAANGGLLSVGGSQTTNATGGNGSVFVTGAGSTISGPGGLSLGVAITQDSIGLLDISNGAVVTTGSGRIGSGQGSNGTINVSGAGSRWDITSGGAGVTIGNFNFADAKGTLNIIDGGVVNYPGGVGWTLGAGGTINVSGSGSALTVPTVISTRGAIRVSDGGTAAFSAFQGQSGASLVVSGPNAAFTTNGFFMPGAMDASGEALLVENGGSLFTGVATINNANFTVTGANSLWRIEADANDGVRIGASASLNVLAGGKVESLTGFNLSVDPRANVLLSGAGSTLDIAANISIQGGNGGGGTFVIENGASLITRGRSDNGLGFNGVLRTLTISNGGSWIMTGGVNSGLQIETTDLLVDGGTLSAEGTISIGLRFTGTSLTLLNSDFTARALNLGSVGGNVVNVGGTRTGPAGAAGLFAVGSVGLSGDNALVLNHTETGYVIASQFSGSANARIEHLAGDTIFTGVGGGYQGLLDIAGGRVRINGTLGGSGGTASVHGGATLGGSGTFAGNVTVSDGILAPGNSPGPLSIGGSLTLGGASVLQFELGAPSGTAGVDGDLINVAGNLVLDGTLNIIDLGGFGGGLYRLINYGGTLTDNGLDIGTVPAAFLADGMTLDLATAGQVNLLVAAPATDFIFWDGSNSSANGRIDGGTGTWTVDGTNWTVAGGSANGAYDPADFLIFTSPDTASPSAVTRAFAATPSAATGTVTVDGTAGEVTLANGVQFAADGYTITGDALRLTSGEIIFRVGDGTTSGANFVATIESALTGSGGLAKTDLGTLILLGSNTYDGGTRVASGTLQGNATSLQGDIAVEQDGTLLFDQTGTGEYSSAISGRGALVKEGAGTLLFSGNSSSYSSQALLSAGGINLTGQLGSSLLDSSLTTAAGTVLSGNGTVANLDLGGTIAPGTASGTGTATFNVLGTATIRAGSTYQVDLSASGASDRIYADDDLIIEGGTIAVNLLDPELSYADGSRFIIAEGGEGLSGTFDGLTENSAFLDFTLGYDSSTAFLTLALVRMFPDVALTFNQRQAATGLMELDQTAASDSLAVYNALLMLDADSARAAFDLASGEIYSDVLISAQRSAFASNAALALRSMELGKAGWDAWIDGGLGNGRVSDDGNGARFTSDTQNIALGLDYHGEDDRWAAGFGGGWSDTDIDNDARHSSARLNGWFANGFLRYGDFGRGLTAVGTASYSSSDGDVARAIRFGSIDRVTGAAIKTSTTSLAADVRYGFGGDRWAIGPVAGIDYAHTKLGAFTESGAGALDLASGGNTDNWARFSAGGFASYRSEGARFLIDLRYIAGKTDNSSTQLSLEGSPQSFSILPARGSNKGFRAAGNAEFNIGGGWSVGGEMIAKLAGEETWLAANVSARLRF